MSNRSIISVIISLIVFSLCYAFYAEFFLYFEPCPLCIAERIILGLLIVPVSIFWIHNPHTKIIRLAYILVIVSLAGFGVKIAAHHVWLTNLPPDQQPLSCGMPLLAMYQNMPLNGFLHKVLAGDAECAKINWHVLGLNAPLAVAILFCLIILLTLCTFHNNGERIKIGKKIKI